MDEDSDIETQNKYRTEFEDLYFKTIAIADNIVVAASACISQTDHRNKNQNTNIADAYTNKVFPQ